MFPEDFLGKCSTFGSISVFPFAAAAAAGRSTVEVTQTQHQKGSQGGGFGSRDTVGAAVSLLPGTLLRKPKYIPLSQYRTTVDSSRFPQSTPTTFSLLQF